MRTDAQATVEFCILDAIAETSGTHDYATIVRVVCQRLFDNSTLWAVKAYADEVGGYQKGQEVEVKHTYREKGKIGGWGWRWWPGVVIKVNPKTIVVARRDIYGDGGLMRPQKYPHENVRHNEKG